MSETGCASCGGTGFIEKQDFYDDGSPARSVSLYPCRCNIEKPESTMPAASTHRMHARAMANVMSAEERCVRLTSERDALKALVSEMIIKAEPFAKLAETFEDDLSNLHPLAFEVATNDNMIDFYLGDLRSLSETVRKAKETVGTR